MNTLSSIAYKDGFDIDVTATIAEAMECMLANKNGSAVLLNDGIPVSIVTESKILSVLEDDMDLSLPISPLTQAPVIVAYHNRPIESAFDLVVTHNIRRLVLIDKNKAYRGVVLQEDLFRFFEEDVYKVDLKVANLLTQEMSIISLGGEKDLYIALILMRHSHIGSVIVTDARGKAQRGSTRGDASASRARVPDDATSTTCLYGRDDRTYRTSMETAPRTAWRHIDES